MSIRLRLCFFMLSFAPALMYAQDDAALAQRCETAVNRFLELFGDLQRHGGWAKIYHYPSFRRYGSGERHTLLAENDLDFGKSWGSAQKNMVLYLPAYDALGDQRWLAVGRKTADLLAQAQTPLGVWSGNYLVLEDGRAIPYGRPDVMGLEDSIQTHPIMFLIWMWRLTKDERYRDSALKGAELLVRAQNSNGSWPQYWSLADGKPRGHGHGVLNDGATTEPMEVLLMMYHATQEARWLAPIPRAADWLIAAQNKQGGIPGWAEQYDAENNPCWARNFEPPAICPTPTQLAVSGLSMAYKLTGDKKYLEPMRLLARWLREHAREEWGFYTNPKTAEPVYGMGGKLYKGAQSPEVRISEWVKMGKHYNAEKIEERIAELEAKRGQAHFRQTTAENEPDPDEKSIRAAELARFAAMRGEIERKLAAQRPDGTWVGTSARTRSEQAVSFLETSQCTQLIHELYRRAVGTGRLPASASGRSDLWFRAWPVADPYNTPLRKGAVPAFDLPPLPKPKPGAGLEPSQGSPPEGGRAVEFREPVPSTPSARGEGVALLASFDAATGDADFAQGDRRAGGVQFQTGQPGRFGSAAAFTTKEAYLLYLGGPNVPGERGRLTLWFRFAPGTNPLADGADHYIGVFKYAPQVAEERGQIFTNEVALLFDGRSKSLCVRLVDARRNLKTDWCAHAAEKLPPDEWHYLSFAWDHPARRLRLALDGRGIAQTVPQRLDAKEILALYLGNGLYYNVLCPLGGWVDDLAITTTVGP